MISISRINLVQRLSNSNPMSRRAEITTPGSGTGTISDGENDPLSMDALNTLEPVRKLIFERSSLLSVEEIVSALKIFCPLDPHIMSPLFQLRRFSLNPFMTNVPMDRGEAPLRFAKSIVLFAVSVRLTKD